MPSKDEAYRRHALHYLTVTRNANSLYSEGGTSFAPGLTLFDLEWANIQAAQEWAQAESGADELAANICNQLPDAATQFVLLRQHPRDQIQWRTAALQCARDLNDRAGEAAHLGNLGLAAVKHTR
ncbi:MAG: hypothetical protein IT331_00765 [Anaerolineae bacterium]|nr:hypothetical protein [Anaerolineae bacterium]